MPPSPSSPAENNAEVKWERAQETWRQTDEAFTKKQDAFSTAGGLLGSAWKNKWDKEFTIAKNGAKVEVLEQAKSIATDKKNDDEVAAITQSLERSKAAEKAAEEALKDIEDDVDKAERMQADAGQFGIIEFKTAQKEFQKTIDTAYEKWDKRFEGVEAPGKEPEDAAIDKDKVKAKINILNSKIAKIKEIIGKKKGSDDEKDKAFVTKGENMLKKIEDDIKAEEEKLNTPKESVADLYSMQIRLNEINIMLNDLVINSGLFEAEESSSPGEGEHATFSQLRTIINKVISKTPDDKKQDIAGEAQEDIAKIKSARATYNAAQNEMAKKFDDNAGEEDDKLHLPKELESYKSYKKVDLTEGLEMIDKYAKELATDHKADVKELPKTTKDGEGTDGNGEEETTEPVTTDDKDAPYNEKDVKEFLEKIEAEKVELEKEKKELEKLKDEQGSATNPDDFIKKIVKQEETIKRRLEDIRELEKKYQEAKKQDQESDESVEPDKIIDDEDDDDDDLENTKDESPDLVKPKPAPKFMKFEDYLATKKKK
jgi:hypothetical protein